MEKWGEQAQVGGTCCIFFSALDIDSRIQRILKRPAHEIP